MPKNMPSTPSCHFGSPLSVRLMRIHMRRYPVRRLIIVTPPP
jgi:hypothetical protein